MTAPVDAARLRRSVRAMSGLTAALGPILAGTVGLTYVMIRMMAAMKANLSQVGYAPPAYYQLLVDFTVRTAPLMVGLGAVFLVGGVWGLWRPRSGGLLAMRVAAALGAVAMLGLAGLWWVAARAQDTHWAWLVAGVAGHVIQAILVVRALQFLSRRDVRDAVLSPADGR